MDLTSYEDLIHRHTVRKDEETKDSKDHGKKRKNHWYTIYFTCLDQFIKQTRMQHLMANS